MEELVRLTRAMLLLQISQVQAAAGEAPGNLKLEVILADAGFAHREIAAILGKSVPAVSKAISRGRIARAKTSGVEHEVTGLEEAGGQSD
jgi:DNA-directed RNA polymerase specialized sigma24 family protein